MVLTLTRIKKCVQKQIGALAENGTVQKTYFTIIGIFESKYDKSKWSNASRVPIYIMSDTASSEKSFAKTNRYLLRLQNHLQYATTAQCLLHNDKNVQNLIQVLPASSRKGWVAAVNE